MGHWRVPTLTSPVSASYTLQSQVAQKFSMRSLVLLFAVLAALLAISEAGNSYYSKSRYGRSRNGRSGWGRNTYRNSCGYNRYRGGYYFTNDDDHYDPDVTYVKNYYVNKDDDYYHLYPSLGGSGSIAGGRYGGYRGLGSRYGLNSVLGLRGNDWWDNDHD